MIYGAWQTGEDFRFGFQPWALSVDREKLTDRAIAEISQSGSKHLCFAQKVGSSDADWTLRGENLGLFYETAGIKPMKEAKAKAYEEERARHVKAASPPFPADNRYNHTIDFDTAPVVKGMK